MAPYDAIEKNDNISVQLQSIMYATAEEIFWKFTSYIAFGVHKIVHSEWFLKYLHEIRYLLLPLCRDVREKFFIGAHL